ncbi:hypothetical protein IQ275_09185 [Nostoc sp. LEGE 12450]|nr:hypothetical protein [Nostoc sp. LEGE 12450]
MNLMQGQTISGRYQILTQLAQGEFGTTFLAQDMQRPGNPQWLLSILSYSLPMYGTCKK